MLPVVTPVPKAYLVPKAWGHAFLEGGVCGQLWYFREFRTAICLSIKLITQVLKY